MGEADPIPAIAETEATGEVAAIYADLRATLGVPFVNLIWRHLATIPDALPAIWRLVRPLYLSDELDTRGADLRAAATVPGVEPLPTALWDCAGFGAEARGEVGRLIDDYNRANSVNFLALSTASVVMRGDVAPGPARRDVAAVLVPRAVPEARPLPSLSDLEPAARALVGRLDGLGRLGESAAIASLYRHLAHWPVFMAIAYAALLPHHRSGVLQTAQQTLVVEGRGIASEELIPLLASDSFSLAQEAKASAIAAVEDFTNLMIGRMTVMGTALRSLLPGQPA